MINTVYTNNIPKPYKHQEQALSFIAEKNIYALFMEQGTGKTKVCLMKLDQLYKRGLVDSLLLITPNAVKEQWIMEEIPLHYGKPYAAKIWDGLNTNKSRDEFYEMLSKDNILRVFAINVEAFQSNRIDDFVKLFCRTVKEPFIIVDESTRIKNPKAKRTIKILNGFKTRPYKAILTGTPTPQSPFDLYGQFEFLYPNFFGGMNYHTFQHYYGILLQETTLQGKKYFKPLDSIKFNIIKNFLNKNQPLTEPIIMEACIRYNTSYKNIQYINNMTEFYPYKNMDELNQKINTLTFKVMKKDCLDLPDKVYEKLIVELSPEQKKLYKSLQKEYLALYSGKEITVNNKMVLTMRLQMITGGQFPYSELEIKKITNKEGEVFEGLSVNYKTLEIKENTKLQALVEDLEEVDKNTQIIIWSIFVGEIKAITKKLKELNYNAECYYGNVSEKERSRIIKEFKSGDIRILVINSSMGSEGLNLQCSTLHYFYSNGYRSDQRLQAEDRSHRSGQVNKVTYKDIICKDTVDLKILQCLKTKIDLINYFRSSSLEDIIY